MEEVSPATSKTKEQQQQQHDSKQALSAAAAAALDNEEALVDVVCGHLKAKLSPSRFGPGFRSRCFWVPGQEDHGWLRPKELQLLADRESSHDWKRSIRIEGKPLKFWLAANRFKLCGKDCQCRLCNEKTTNIAKIKGKPKVKSKITVKCDNSKPKKKSLPGIGEVSPLSSTTSSSSSTKMPPVSSKKRTSADRDSDSGVSSLSASYAKALLVDINSLSQEAAAGCSKEADNSTQGPSSSNNNNRLLMEDETDYLALIQEALAALNTDSGGGGGGGGGGVPLIHVLLYVLHNHPHSDSLGPEEVSAVHLRVRHGLLFLARMGVVDKFRLEGAAAGPSDSDTEDIESQAVVFKKTDSGSDDKATSVSTAKTVKKSGTPSSAKAVNKDKKPTKAKQQGQDKKKAGLKLGLKIKSKLSGDPQKSKIKKKKIVKGDNEKKEGGASKEPAAAKPVVKRNYRPLKLSPQLSELCGGVDQLTRPEVLQKVWRYVKENQLQHPEQKTIIMADDTLRKVTKKRKVPQTMLMGMIDKHLKQQP